MLGLPYSANAGDVINFFEGLNIVPGGIHFLVNSSGRASGQAYVEFATAEDADRAQGRHRATMGTRYIELFRCTKGEMLLDLQTQAGLPLLQGAQSAHMGLGGMGGLGMNPHAALGGMGPGGLGGMGGMGGMGAMGGGMGGMGAMGGLGGMGGLGAMGGYGGMSPQQLAEVYVLLQQMGMMNPMAPPPPNPAAFAWPPQAAQPPPQQPPAQTRYAGGGAGMMGGGMGGVNVRMRGLPYHATVGDIATFFAGYDVNRNAIVLGGGADGRPNGEAWVQFSSPEEAARAVHEKNRAHMGSRYVELFMA